MRGSCKGTASTYFWAAPVLNTTTVSSDRMSPRRTRRSRQSKQTAVSGQTAIPSLPATRRIHSPMRCSSPAMAQPPLARMASSIMKSPTAAGTRRPLATVWALGNNSAKRSPFSKARTMGAQPSLWQLMSRGILSFRSQPSSRSSLNAFHMPMRPVPPPVG